MAAPTVATPSDHAYAHLITYRGVINTGNPWDVTGGGIKTTASTTVSLTSVTTTVPDTLIVQVASRPQRLGTGPIFSAQTNASLTGIAERSDGGTDQGQGGGFAVWDGVKATAGATGATTATMSTALTNAFLTIALMPPPPAPSLVFMKTVSVTSDPVNGTTNPKNIPGAEVLYTLRVTNTGAGTVDNNTILVTDPIPANTDLFVGDLGAVGSGPIVFVQGTPTSNLTYTFTSLASSTDDVEFSNDGGTTWTYVPTPPFAPAVNRIRLNPKGIMAGASGGLNPFFELRFRVRIR